MGRSSRRKKGKAAKAARRGLLGLSATVIGKKKSKQFEKRVEQRLQKKDEARAEEVLRENVSGSAAKLRDAAAEKPPHSFVIHIGQVGRYVRQLEKDLRRLMSPHTSAELRVTKRNNFKDFVVNSQYLGVSHLLVLTKSSLSVNMRICRNPQGPTLHFRVEKYSLSRDILAAQKRPLINEQLFEHSPLVVLNGFGAEGKKHLQLVQTIFQNMFPTIDVDRVKLATIRRALLLHYVPEEELIELRHYSIRAVPAGVSRSAKKLLQTKIPDLSKYEDISDFLINPGQLSDSEFEGEQVELELPQDIGGRGKKQGQRTKLRLLEIGPRMSLRLTKIEEGLNEGEVLYHAFVAKSSKEIAQLRQLAPRIKKKKLRHEKQVEHSTIRKMRAQTEKEKHLAEMDDQERRALLEKQREVTGDYSSSGSEDEGGRMPAAENDADDEMEQGGDGDGGNKRRRRMEMAGKKKITKKIESGAKKRLATKEEGNGEAEASKSSPKMKKKKRGAGSRFK